MITICQRITPFVLALFLGSGAVAQEKDAAAKVPPPAVIVEAASMQTIDSAKKFAGRTEALNRVELIARVGGFLDKVSFKEGQLVKEGDLLYTIQKAPYKFAVDRAKASVDAAQAQVDLAKVDFSRKETLVKKDTISVSELDTARATLQEAEATLELRKADLDLAQLDLSYAEISAPVTGRISKSNYQLGAYVTAQSGTLATVTSMDPIRVAFPVPQAVLLAGKKQGLDSSDKLKVNIILTDGTTYEHSGKIDYLDAAADASTDSVTARALFANPDGLLFDNQLIDISVSQKDPQPVLTVPQAALLIDQKGPFVIMVDKDNVAQQQRITIREQINGLVVVSEGLKKGDLVITNGIQKVRPGQPVNPKLAGQ
ncbi:efflux RND transporter periplasmic adaptor subunit [Polycladidibacter hongkongensis]|uniref:efflux RND transporter periplasmic adaptor subunit n=1 Tax=Polycladidibacter hongkongensis TaxID=1647556 RepID=UPI000831CAC8|nr:efflux RND transporter periplasmic adaptor subunit [Pseudovibrio hongkongensis]